MSPDFFRFYFPVRPIFHPNACYDDATFSPAYIDLFIYVVVYVTIKRTSYIYHGSPAPGQRAIRISRLNAFSFLRTFREYRSGMAWRKSAWAHAAFGDQ